MMNYIFCFLNYVLYGGLISTTPRLVHILQAVLNDEINIAFYLESSYHRSIE